MDHNKETFETWNKLASLYEEKFMDLDLYNESYDIFCGLLPTKNAKILELGCGPGNITKYLLSKRPDFIIDGTDIAPNMIELAKKNNPSVNFRVMDCRAINEITDSFDGIVCGFIIPYLSPTELNQLIINAIGLLNKDGIIYLSFVEGDPNKSGFKTASTGDRSYFFYHELEIIKKQLLNLNFEIKNLVNVNYKTSNNEIEVHSILIATKN
jgi:SAM-dependent methyltransferase